MSRVLLIHCRKVPDYRLTIYAYLSEFLHRYGFSLTVLAEGIEGKSPDQLTFPYMQMPLSAFAIARYLRQGKFDVAIMFVDMRHRYLFPTYLLAKGLLRRKMIYWGQGRDLLDQRSSVKNLAYQIEQACADAIILYAEHLKKYVPRRFHHKVFVANNTLCIDYRRSLSRSEVFRQHGIHTQKNIICVGRIQKRKRIENLVAAHARMNRPDVGLVLVGPDPDGILAEVNATNIYKLGALYGETKFDLLSACDVFCLPGAVGLSIVDAFYCGLPFVTEDGDESAEIAYLHHGKNGFIVPPGDIEELAQKLLLVLDDASLRHRFSAEARREAEESASIDKMCRGFRDALLFVSGQSQQ